MNFSKLQIADQLFQITSDEGFNECAKEIFQVQRSQVAPFREYLDLISWQEGQELPFMPIELFKHYRLNRFDREQAVFRSSGTSSDVRSSHYVHDVNLYSELSACHFETLYGDLKSWTILALLPSYLENGDSSLIFMVNDFIQKSHNPKSCFVRDEVHLNECLSNLGSKHSKTLLIGVSYALLDFSETHCIQFPNIVVMETGGMKGRKQELTRSELHKSLMKGFPQSQIHSEYGMTELLSQAYSEEQKPFVPPRWMKAFATDISDPFHRLPPGKRGLLAFIDLANIHSCSFIQTRDIGIINDSGHFTVEGRLDNSDIRGCNLLYT